MTETAFKKVVFKLLKIMGLFYWNGKLETQLDVPPVKFGELTSREDGEPSQKIRERVMKAREIQKERFKPFRIHANTQMNGRLLRKFCALEETGAKLLEKATIQLNLSARAYDRILKVSRTIADLGGSDKITLTHLSEAIHYRSLDRNLS